MTDTKAAIEAWQRTLVELGKAPRRPDARRFREALKVLAEKSVFPADLRQALAEVAELMAECDRLDAGGPRGKTKSGRPGFWKSVEGLRLVEAVKETRAKEPCTIRIALQRVIRSDPRFTGLLPIGRRAERALETRYKEADKHWSWIWSPDRKDRAEVSARLMAARERLAAAIARWQPAAGWPPLPKDFT